ncbi:hypothetical protein QO002_004519 [Pararhizobium capsulatum DSM 1112]|uniref:Uncharacterized protein n=1 Tax=Pararhizobium capsulatum DSM 1112 TaxID=1121113 RepID=A0ABU0BWH9_9HYPH|nr:hypothetical protein [Pararhizobium capsulatum]MDQ0322313.1 hypothetical protein [Pararhizobium capsulatum DSM 1112]
MSISELIVELQHADGPDRKLDVEIATMLGYERRAVTVKTGAGKDQTKKLWFHPKRNGTVQIPKYTENIDVARKLAATIVPRCSAGFTWGTSFATAKINQGRTVMGATPALALCIAALSAKYVQEK